MDADENKSKSRKCKSKISDLKPTWEILGFDEDISKIPCENKYKYGRNPLDKRMAYKFMPGPMGNYVYCLPMIGRTLSSAEDYNRGDLSELFDTTVVSLDIVNKYQSECVRSFLYEMVLGQSYVFRKFEITIFCDKTADGTYKSNISMKLKRSSVLIWRVLQPPSNIINHIVKCVI